VNAIGAKQYGIALHRNWEGDGEGQFYLILVEVDSSDKNLSSN